MTDIPEYDSPAALPEVTDPVLQALIDTWPTESHDVREWHPDDQVLHREGDFGSFDERHAFVVRQQQERLLKAIREAQVKVLRPMIDDAIKNINELEDSRLDKRTPAEDLAYWPMQAGLAVGSFIRFEREVETELLRSEK